MRNGILYIFQIYSFTITEKYPRYIITIGSDNITAEVPMKQ